MADRDPLPFDPCPHPCAQAASSAGAGSSDGVSGILSKDRARLIPRPSSFAPADYREQEVVQWKDWYWTLQQYLVVVVRELQQEIEQIESNLANEVDWDLMGKAEQDRSRFLYSLLGSLIQGHLVGVVQNVENFNGYEALRQLLSNCQPQARNRTMSLLQVIMAYPSFNMKGSLLPQILKLEEHFIQYERLSGSKLPADMKAVLLRAVGGRMKVHLNLTLNEGSSYQKIREAILAFDTAATKWNESAAISCTTSSPMTQAVGNGGVMPMEVDRLQKGDGKKEKAKERKGQI